MSEKKVTPNKADIKAAREAQVDMIVAGFKGDKEAWRRVEERFAMHRLAASDGAGLRDALRRAIETLAASRHLIGKYAPEHHWLPEHDNRIAELKATLAALSEPYPEAAA